MEEFQMSKRRTKVVERKRKEIKEEKDDFVPMSARARFAVPSYDVSSGSEEEADLMPAYRERQRSPEERSIERTRDRPVSPYSQTMERWTQFKSVEAKLLNYAKDKLAKYDASPEEHPQYGEEWKQFWQKRYSEVKMEGLNSDTYDYLKEWIPFWSNKSREILDEEVEQRRAELLQKYRLESDRLPIRSDFQRSIKTEVQKPEKATPEKPAFRPAPPAPSIPQPQAAKGEKKETSASEGVEGVANMWKKLTASDNIKLPEPGKTLPPPICNKILPDSKPKLVPVLRLIGAFMDSLGDLADDIDPLLTKGVALERSYEGASKILLEDANVLATLDHIRVKLARGKSDGSVDPSMLGSLDNCLTNIDRLLGEGGDSYEPRPSPFSRDNRSVLGVSSEPSIERDNGSVISGKTTKDISNVLRTEEEVKRFLCESVALVLLQTGRRTFTKEGLYSVMAELMSKLETVEKDNKIGTLAKQFNAVHLVKMALKDPSNVQQQNPGMDLLKFTPEELVCLLKNFDTLSGEERRCFQYYMTNLQMKRASLSNVEINILDLYLLKTQEVEMGFMVNQGIMGQSGDDFLEEVEFRPVTFDYSHNKGFNAGRVQGDGFRRGREMGPNRRDNWDNMDVRDIRDNRRRDRSRSRERERRRERDVSDRLGPPRSKQGPPRNDVRVEKRKKGALDKELDNLQSQRDKKRREGETGPERPVEEVVVVQEQEGKNTDLNPDGSVNLSKKYKDARLNLWVRNMNGEERPLFQEKEENSALIFSCMVCSSTLFGVRNAQVHYDGKKHVKRIDEEGWSTFDPVEEPPKARNAAVDTNGDNNGEVQVANQLEKEMEEFENQLRTIDDEIVIE